jgi:hypothetical protein
MKALQALQSRTQYAISFSMDISLMDRDLDDWKFQNRRLFFVFSIRVQLEAGLTI